MLTDTKRFSRALSVDATSTPILSVFGGETMRCDGLALAALMHRVRAIDADRRPGEYPSGGPYPFTQASYRVAAPAIDFYAPDIYWPDFERWVTRIERKAIRPSCRNHAWN